MAAHFFFFLGLLWHSTFVLRHLLLRQGRLLDNRKATHYKGGCSPTGVLFATEKLLTARECDRRKGVLASSEVARRKGVAGLHVLPLFKGSRRTVRIAVACEDEDTPLFTAIVALLHVSCCCIVVDAVVRTSFHAAAMSQRRQTTMSLLRQVEMPLQRQARILVRS